jgi:hypothetical protein
MEAVEQIEVDNLTVKIFPDSDPESPREWDNLGTMVCFHRRYNLGDKDHDFKTPEEFNKFLENNYDELVVLPLYLYDHSGITMNTTGFSCPWDSGQVGWIYVDHSKIKNEFGVVDVEKIKKQLRCEVETYDQFISDQVYGYKIFRDGEEVDSCWGFYGLDCCTEEAVNSAKYYAEKVS